MRINLSRIGKAIAPLAVIALGLGLSACDGKVTINGEEGKKLAELDLSGPAPTEIALFGPDEVRVVKGDKLAIAVEADDETKEQLRFSLKDGTLGIMRGDKLFGSTSKIAIVTVTMPDPKEVVMGGSGKIVTGALDPDAKVTVLGSGTIESGGLTSKALDLNILGSGSYKASGTVSALDVTVLGSGQVQLDSLKADKVEVEVMGSGSTSLASDGTVSAKIMGSGNVSVKGQAKCTVSAMGSGTLTCESGPATVVNDDDKAAPAAPEAPEAPEAPKAP